MLCLPYQFRVICHKEFCCSFGYRIEKYKVSILINELQRGMHFKKKAIRSSLWKKSDTCHIWENKFCPNLNCLNEPIIELRRKIQLSHFKEKKIRSWLFLLPPFTWNIHDPSLKSFSGYYFVWIWRMAESELQKNIYWGWRPPPAPTFPTPLFWNICLGANTSTILTIHMYSLCA